MPSWEGGRADAGARTRQIAVGNFFDDGCCGVQPRRPKWKFTMINSQNETRIGFVGLGQMGRPMALNLLNGGAQLTVMSQIHDAYAEFRERGATTVEAPSELCGMQIVFLSLPNDHAVKSVLFGEQGLADVLTPGAIVVDTSTISHSATVEIEARLAQQGVEFLDAPVSGMQARAENGTLTIMCGGRSAAFERVRPWLERMGENILFMGGPGCGQLTKLINQLLFDINCAAVAEIVPMAVKMGLDAEKVATVVNSGTGRSYASEFFLPRVLARHFSDGYPMENAYKDLVSAAEMGAKHCIPMPVLAAATTTYQMSLLRGRGKQDKGAMMMLFEELLGVEYRASEQ